MGLFDKLKSLVSDDKKDTGTIEIVAPLSGEIVNIEDVPDVVLLKKSLVMASLSNQPVIKWSPLLMAPSAKSLKPTTLSLSNPTAALSCLFTSVLIPLN